MSTVYSAKCSSPRLERRFDPKSGKYCASSKRSGPQPASWEDPRVILQSSHHSQHLQQQSTSTSTSTSSPTPPTSAPPTSSSGNVCVATSTAAPSTNSSSGTPNQSPALPLKDMTNRTLDLITRGILIALQERSSMIPVDEGLYKKLTGLFPSVQEDELRQLCKKNYNNELAVMGDLTARGYRPVYTPPPSSNRTTYAPTQGRYTPTPNSSATTTTTLRYTPNSYVPSTTSYTPSINSFSGTPTHHVKLGTTATKPAAASLARSGNVSAQNQPLAVSTSSAAATTTLTAASTADTKSGTFWGKSVLPARSYSPCPQADSYTSGIPPPPPQTHPVFSYSQAFSKTPVPAPRSSRASPQPPQPPVATPPPPTSSQQQQQPTSTSGTTTTTGTVSGQGGRCYYPGRFVQGVGFEPGSMGGSPQLTGKPFGPLQGRYSLSGMITEKNSGVARTAHLHAVPREPSYPQPVPNPYQGLPGITGLPPPVLRPAPYSAPPAAAVVNVCSSPARPLTPQSSWYGGESTSGMPEECRGAPVPAPRLYNVVHDALVRHRVTDRSCSPPVSVSPRAYSPVFVSDGYQPRAPTPPTVSGGSSSFYATASRLYAQSPRLQGRAGGHSPPQHLLGGTVTPPPPASTHSLLQQHQQQQLQQQQQYVQAMPFAHHYHAPARPAPSVYAPPVAPHYQTPTTPAATAPGFPYYRTYSPIGHSDSYQSRGSPGSHSPKIKLRYLRRIYPGVDETILLDVLANSDNNVQTAMQELNTSGYIKIETPPTRPSQQHPPLPPPASAVAASRAPDPMARLRQQQQQQHDHHRPVAPPRRLTEADKQKTRARMLERVKEVPAAILTFALESVDFDEERAMILLTNMKAAEDRHKETNDSNDTDSRIKAGLANLESALQNKLSCGHTKAPVVPIRRSQKDGSSSTQSNVIMCSKSTWTQEDNGFRSRYRSEAKGPDSGLRKGPNRDLLGRDTNGYTHGRNLDNCRGPNLELIQHETTPEENASHLSAISTSKGCWARGNQHDLPRGHQPQLSQGSSYKFG